MLLKTHLAIVAFFILLLIDSVEHKLVFVLVAVVATYIPDVDSRFSSMGHRKLARLLQLFTKHRGIIHSFTSLFAVTLLLVLFFPVVSLGFFLGYGIHLLSDSFTVDGVQPFYPWKRKMKGGLRTGGRVETGVLVAFIVVDVALFFVKFLGIGQ